MPIPLVIAAASYGAAAIGSVAGGVMGGKSAAKQRRIERDLTRARITEKKREQTAALTSMSASYTMSGVRSDQGSPLAVMAEAARAYGEEIKNIRIAGAATTGALSTQKKASYMQGGMGALQSIAGGAGLFVK